MDCRTRTGQPVSTAIVAMEWRRPCKVTCGNPAAVRTEYGLTSFKDLKALASNYDAIVAAVAHREFSDMSLRKYTCADGVIFDLKGFVPRDIVDGRL